MTTTTYYRSPKDDVVRLRRNGEVDEWAIFDRSDRHADWLVADNAPWPTYREKLVEIPRTHALVHRTAVDRVRMMHRSVSQVEQYEKCPKAYELQRIERAWQRPAAWLPHGLAVHKTVELIERSRRTMEPEAAHAALTDEYVEQTNRLASDGVSFAHWSPSGRYAGAEDVERRFGLAHEQVDRYFTYNQAHPDDAVWIAPDGTPGVELGFDIDLDGVRMIGYIDQVRQRPGERPRVVDVKTGAKPGGDFQLGTYRVAIGETYGVWPDVGEYWMGKTGRATKPYDLSAWPRDAIAERVTEVDLAIKAEAFDPKPEPDKCRMCSVSRACAFSLA